MRIARSAIKAAIVDLLEARTVLSTVNPNTGHAPQITRSFEDVWQSRERIVIGEVVGELSIPTIRAGAKTTQDEFDLSVYVVVAIPGQSVEDNEDRCTVLLEDIVAALNLSGDLGGSVAGVFSAHPTRLEGPDDELSDVGGVNTHSSVAVLTVSCKVRTQPT